MTDQHSDRALATYVSTLIEGLKDRKDLAAIARDANLRDTATLTSIASGSMKMPIDEVRTFAHALQCDVYELMGLALDQFFDPRDVQLIVRTGAATVRKDLDEAWATLLAVATNLQTIISGLDEATMAAEKLSRMIGDNQDRLTGLRMDIEKRVARLGS